MQRAMPTRGGKASARQLQPRRLLLLLLLAAVWLDLSVASEFPERECCDSIPPLPAQFTTPPVSAVTGQSDTSPSTTAKPTAIAVRTKPPIVADCKVARQLCQGNTVCQHITSIIPRLCGHELVACSTVTVTKCKAALRTLVAFQFFQPTCLCKERRVDPECNTYRNLVFDHPCLSAKQLDRDPFPIQALPTCEYALNACHRQRSCSRVYHNYLRLCPYSAEKCDMKNSSACLDAWIALKKLTPLYGCICTNFRDWNCERTFKTVHENPCIDCSQRHHHQPEHQHQPDHQHQHQPDHRRIAHYPLHQRTIQHSTPPAGLPHRPTHWHAVNGLGAASGSRRLVDRQLVAPLFDLTSERPRASTMERTLYGPKSENLKGSSDQERANEQPTTTVEHVTPGTANVSESSGGDEAVFQSSCHTALSNCRRDRHCRLQLEPVLASCSAGSCDRGRCMTRLQEFYSQSDSALVMDAALCVCRRSGSGDGGCVAAMEQLHPTCASQPESGSLPACHRVARHCQRQEDGRCRPRLERYEQACAVDVVTGRCAGPTEHCRQALLAVLGTRLHTRCACRESAAAATSRHQSCRDWERLLWGNSCVELSQWEYLMRQPSGSPLHGPPAAVQPAFTADPPTTSSGQQRQAARRGGPRPVNETAAGGATVRPSQPHCVVRKPGRPNDYLPVGAGVRYYRLEESDDQYRDERDCSELCMCHGRSQLVCNVLDCLEKRQCKSSLAQYHHGTAGLLPYREGCICHYGDFICMRPPADDYTLPFGVFLFLGYSRADQDMLYPHTHKTVKDHVIEELESMLELVLKKNKMRLQDWQCTLSVKQHFEKTDNIIIQARLRQVEKLYNRTINKEILGREKAECSEPLRELSFMINNREPAILSHPLLSVFKMADLEVTIPDLSAAPRGRPSLLLSVFGLLLLALHSKPT